MKTGIHQPNFLPHVGYFRKIALSDVFVFLDDVQFTKGGYTNRTKISAERYLTVPVAESSFKRISDLEIHNPDQFYTKLAKRLGQDYKDWYFLLKEVIETGHTNLADLNIEIINKICQHFQVNTPFIKSSSLKIEGKSNNELLIEIVKKSGGNIYLTNKAGYLDADLFEKNKLQMEYYNSMQYSNGMSIITNSFEEVFGILNKTGL